MKRQNVKSSDDRSKKRSVTAVHVGGVGLCLFCIAITFIGTSSAVDALNRNYGNSMNVPQPITYISADAGQSDTSSVSDTTVKSDDSSVKDSAEDDYTTDQLDWAHRYHISWDSFGNPVDEDGNVMNDPTTTTNEVARAMKNGTANDEGISVDFLAKEKPQDDGTASVPELYQGVDGVSKTSDGKYVYTVKSGDSIGKIANATGVSSAQIIELNKLANPSMIYVGEQIMLPADGVVDNSSGAGLG